jgi:23S rRNA pseudouridine2604 synthase
MNEGTRINKYLAESGVCSRREADKLVEAGKVLINGETATNGSRVMPGDSVSVSGKKINGPEQKAYLAFYKPTGIVCTAERREENNIMDYIDYPVRVTYCGRLDKDSEGLLLLSNDGDLMQLLMRGANNHEREYLVRVNKPLTDEFLSSMEKGVFLPELNVTTKRCSIRKISDVTFTITLKQGLNRQIRRMCRAFDYHVRFLKRVRIENIQLGDMEPGSFRELEKDELAELKRRVYGQIRKNT